MPVKTRETLPAEEKKGLEDLEKELSSLLRFRDVKTGKDHPDYWE